MSDSMYQQAVDLMRKSRRASTSFIQRTLGIGYTHAAALMLRMEAEGVVSKSDHVGRRDVLLDPPTEV